MSAADPALVAAVLEALAAKGYTVTPPAAAPTVPPPAEAEKDPRPTYEVSCHRCGLCGERHKIRAEGWNRTPKGWECFMHTPIDWSYAGDLASSVIDHAEEAFRRLMARDVAALDDIDELAYALADLQGVVRQLRQKPAA